MKKRIKILVALGIFVTIILVVLMVNRFAIKQDENLNDLDYSLVFDAKYYAENNSDIRASVGDDEMALFNHFLTYGMKEGRVGIANFNVKYYQNHNPDLAEAYGEEYPPFYEHYMKYGYEEGRKGSSEDTSSCKYELELHCKLKKNEKLVLSITYNKKKKNEKYFILEMPAYENDFQKAKVVSEFGGCFKKNITIQQNKITNKYMIAKLVDDKYEQVSNIAYIQNPEIACKDNQKEQPKPKTKKGLQIKVDGLDMLQDLEPSYCFFNIFIEEILLTKYVQDNTIIYKYEGDTYYFNKTSVQFYDKTISKLTNDGYCVMVSILLRKHDDYKALYYPNIAMDTEAKFYAINTSDQQGEKYFEAFMSFMSNRYNGTNAECGLISKWTIGNEVNDNGIYNYMGETELEDYLDEYIRTFRIAYNIIKSNYRYAGVYVPMEPWWGIHSDMLKYGGREFLNVFNYKMKQSGNIDWGLAYHAYSYPIGDPKILNDDTAIANEAGYVYFDGVTRDSEYTAIITMKNIDVLTEFMKQDEFLLQNGEVRSIILSEQGYTSNSYLYGKCEALQSTSMLYAYYKAEMNDDIDAFIYFLQMDDPKASLGNDYYQFGLSYRGEQNEIIRKYSYDIFKNMDKKDSLEKFAYLKKVIGINDFSEVISNFDDTIFNSFDESDKKQEEKKDISKVQISKIENQKYTGEECMPEVVVQYNGSTLINDVDYDVAYLNNVETGTAKAVIVGLGEYEGAKEEEFLIEE